jgi:hypothetical protein
MGDRPSETVKLYKKIEQKGVLWDDDHVMDAIDAKCFINFRLDMPTIRAAAKQIAEEENIFFDEACKSLSEKLLQVYVRLSQNVITFHDIDKSIERLQKYNIAFAQIDLPLSELRESFETIKKWIDDPSTQQTMSSRALEVAAQSLEAKVQMNNMLRGKMLQMLQEYQKKKPIIA